MSDIGEGEKAAAEAKSVGPTVTLRAWLASREPAAPVQLVDRLNDIVGPRALDGDMAPNVLLDSGVATLRSALSDRDGALDLLAADALITYAMEAAAEDFATMEETAADAIQRIASGTE